MSAHDWGLVAVQALVNGIAQGLALIAVVELVTRALGLRQAAVRYVVRFVALLAVAFLPAA